MKLLKINFSILVFLLLSFFLPSNSVRAQDDFEIMVLPPLNHIKLIEEFFINNPSPRYLTGIRQFYLGSLFSYVFIEGELEDKFTDLLFIIPFGGKVGLAIQGDQRNILDAFLFIYEPRINEFAQKNDQFEGSLLRHRNGVLRELPRIRFMLTNRHAVNAYLLQYGIWIE